MTNFLNRNLKAIIFANIMFGMIMPLLIVLGGITGYQLAPANELATVPAALQPLSGVMFAILISLYMGKYGRRMGFILGAFFSFAGGILGMLALHFSSFLLICIAHLTFGLALACFGFFRFAAAESVQESKRASAISIVLGTTLFSAILGPNIFPLAKHFFPNSELTISYGSVSLIALLGLIPLLGLSNNIGKTENGELKQKSQWLQNLNFYLILKSNHHAILPLFACAVSFGAMMFMMSPTSLAIKHHGYSEFHASNVIVWHVVAMFAPSFFTGALIERFGANKITTLGFIVLLMAFVVSLIGETIPYFYIALVLLGLGWNFSFIGASSLLDNIARGNQRASLLGLNETLVSLSSSFFSLFGGIALAFYEWQAISIIGLVLIAIMVTFMYALQLRK
jgi:MFS family permease